MAFRNMYTAPISEVDDLNLEEILNEINKDIDDTIDAGDLIGWVNRALDIASTVDKYEQRVTLLFDEGVSDYALPDDLIKLMYVFGTEGKYEELPLDDYTSTGYKQWGNVIGFQNVNEASVDLYYHAYYPHLVNMEDVPALPVPFHDLLILYTVARARYKDEEESLEADAMNEFNRRLVEFRNFVSMKRKKPSVRMKTVW